MSLGGVERHLCLQMNPLSLTQGSSVRNSSDSEAPPRLFLGPEPDWLNNFLVLPVSCSEGSTFLPDATGLLQFFLNSGPFLTMEPGLELCRSNLVRPR